MAWDFATEPEFEQQLETLDLSDHQLKTAIQPLQESVKQKGLWASHLPPELSEGGFGQVKLGLMHEILGQSAFAPVVFGNNAPDSGNAELIAARSPTSSW